MRLIHYLTRQATRQALMTSNFERHLLGPCVIFILLVLGEVGVRFYDFPITLAIPYAVLSLVVYRWSGLRSALFSALLISLYPPLFQYEWYGFWGSVIIAAGAFIIAGPSGILKRALREQILETGRERLKAKNNQEKADFVDGLNGNIELLREINQDLIRLSLAVDMMPKKDITENLSLIQDKAANLAQRAIGWHQLAQDKKLVKGEI